MLGGLAGRASDGLTGVLRSSPDAGRLALAGYLQQATLAGGSPSAKECSCQPPTIVTRMRGSTFYLYVCEGVIGFMLSVPQDL